MFEHLDTHDPVEGALVLLCQVKRVDVPGNYAHVSEPFLLGACGVLIFLLEFGRFWSAFVFVDKYHGILFFILRRRFFRMSTDVIHEGKRSNKR